MAEPRVSFIIPVHGRWDLVESLLDSLFASWISPVAAPRCMIVDDASTKPMPEALAVSARPIRVIRNATSIGFGASINRAMRELPEPLVVLLNSDLVLTAGWLPPMLNVMLAEPEAFAVGNIQERVDDGTLDHAGIVFAHEGYPAHFRPAPALLDEREYSEFPAATAACLLVRRDRFLALGGFDETYRNGFEDIDLCLRARMRGWPTFVSNRSRIGHHISASPGRKTHEEENAALFLARWRPLTAVWQRDWENRLLHEAYARTGHTQLPRTGSTAPPDSRIRVMVDLARLQPGGANGGIKVLVRESLQALRSIRPGAFCFLLVVARAVAVEARTWVGETDEIWVLPDDGEPESPLPAGIHPLAVADASLARLLAATVLYCPLGVTDFLTPDVPVVGVAVDLLHRERPECLPPTDVSVREAWFDRMLRTSYAIQCNSEWVAGRVRKHYPNHPDQLFVVHNAVHTRHPSRLAAPQARDPLFFYPANAWPHKNHDTLLVAYRIYSRRVGPLAWRLVLTGFDDPAMRRVMARARALGLDGQVEYHGFVTDADLAQLWARVGALVFPSLHEGFGIPLLESMEHGVPIIAGNVGSIPEVAGDAYLETDVRDPGALACALERLSSDPALRSELADRGRRRAARFDFEREVGRLAEVLSNAAHQFQRAGITWEWETHGARHAHRV